MTISPFSGIPLDIVMFISKPRRTGSEDRKCVKKKFLLFRWISVNHSADRKPRNYSTMYTQSILQEYKNFLTEQKKKKNLCPPSLPFLTGFFSFPRGSGTRERSGGQDGWRYDPLHPGLQWRTWCC